MLEPANITYLLLILLQFDRQSSIRFSSRRARTLESLASLYEVIISKRLNELKLMHSVYHCHALHALGHLSSPARSLLEHTDLA